MVYSEQAVNDANAWTITEEPPAEAGIYWITLRLGAERWLHGPVRWGGVCRPGGGCWPVNAVGFSKIDEPEPMDERDERRGR